VAIRAMPTTTSSISMTSKEEDLISNHSAVTYLDPAGLGDLQGLICL
jgi:hypothetical protein